MAQISSRKVLQQVLQSNGVGDESFGPVCVIVDKLDKIGQEKVGSHFSGAASVHFRCSSLGVSAKTMTTQAA